MSSADEETPRHPTRLASSASTAPSSSVEDQRFFYENLLKGVDFPFSHIAKPGLHNNDDDDNCDSWLPFMFVESKLAKNMWTECLKLGRNIQMYFESETLGLNLCPGDNAIVSANEINLRSEIYNAIFNRKTLLEVKEIKDHNHPSKLSASLGLSAYMATLKDCSARSASDSSRSISNQKQIVVLGALLGAIKDVDNSGSVSPASIDNDKKCVDRTHMTENNKNGNYNEESCTSTLSPLLTPKLTVPENSLREILKEPTKLNMRLLPTPSILFSSALSSGQQYLECSPGCPAFYVSHTISSWEMLHELILGSPAPMLRPEECHPLQFRKANAEWHIVTALGLPFLILTSKPFVNLSVGDEVLADRGSVWTCEARKRAWIRIWADSLRLRNIDLSPCVVQAHLQSIYRCKICGVADGVKERNKNRVPDLATCGCCGGIFHIMCLTIEEQNLNKRTLSWSCSFCRNRVKACEKSIDLRSDESPLSRLSPCQKCRTESDPLPPAAKRHLSIRCRVNLGHMGLSLSPKTRLREVEHQAMRTISSLAEALQISEARNVELQKASTAASCHLLRQYAISNNDIMKAVEFWKHSKEKCRTYESLQENNSITFRRMSSLAPPSVFSSSRYLKRRYEHIIIAPLLKSSAETAINGTKVENEAYTNINMPATTSATTTFARQNPQQQPYTIPTSTSRHVLPTRRTSALQDDTHYQCQDNRPQAVARGLLRGAFDPPDRSTVRGNLSCSLAFNEANMQAKRLKPWPRGISWNMKRLTWSVRFWGNDGRTLVATSIPARKHGGVDEAFQKAVALRRKSYSNVLGRVANEVSEGYELSSLEWSRGNNSWTATANDEQQAFLATSEEAVYAGWLEALRWLDEKGEESAGAILVALQNNSHHKSASPHDHYQQIQNSSSFAYHFNNSNRSRTATPTVAAANTTTYNKNNTVVANQEPYLCDINFDCGDKGISNSFSKEPAQHAASPLLSKNDHNEATANYSNNLPVLKKPLPSCDTTSTTANRQVHQSVKALQPLPPGLIWARTTNRFFAVFRDPSGSSLHRKKRFKTFDPKKYGSVHEAHRAALEFLESVEPWVTQGVARRGGRRTSTQRHNNVKQQSGRYRIVRDEDDEMFEDDLISNNNTHNQNSNPFLRSVLHHHSNKKPINKQSHITSIDDHISDQSIILPPTKSLGSVIAPPDGSNYDSDEDNDDEVVPNGLASSSGHKSTTTNNNDVIRHCLNSDENCLRLPSVIQKTQLGQYYMNDEERDDEEQEEEEEDQEDGEQGEKKNQQSNNDITIKSKVTEKHFTTEPATTSNQCSSNTLDWFCNDKNNDLGQNQCGTHWKQANNHAMDDDVTNSLKVNLEELYNLDFQNDEALCNSDDSASDFDEEVQRLPKLDDIYWDSDQQVFQISTTARSLLMGADTSTATFNPFYYQGVKRAFRHAVLHVIHHLANNE